MANTNRANFLLGVDVDKRDTTPEFELGTCVHGSNGDRFVYVQASGAVAASQTNHSVDAAGQLTDDNLGAYECSAVAFADNEYGWVWTNVTAG